ncbi:MAG: hypothetical protein WCP70_02570 [Methanothrix sp.]
MKKEWKKPQLVVVVRGSAEERVLGACKSFITDEGAATFDDSCLGSFSEACEAACASIGQS